MNNQLKLHLQFSDFCPPDYPFAYLNGQKCCRTDQEYKNGGTSREKKSGTCDGINFNRESTCCKDKDDQTCPHINGCFDYDENHDKSKDP